MSIALQPRPESQATAALARPVRVTPPLPAIVEIVDERASPQRLRLLEGRCVIGAGEGADLLVHHAAISRRHVELELVPEGVAVRDLASRNGTFYAGQRVESMVVALGSRIQLGPVQVVIRSDLEALGHTERSGYHELLGRSPSMRRLFGLLARLEGSLVNVLVQGPSGVGKELVARAIHHGSSRAHRPLVVLNCGAIGRELVLSELFGHRRGAFTGAQDDRRGAFELADGGTLFLDEIGELPLDVQPVLLRALETGEVKRLGDDQPTRVRVRTIAATNRDLREAVAERTFREDLYYRLAVVTLSVPPLDERAEDIPVLARHFADREGGALEDEVVSRFAARRWPGNARELRNAVASHLALGPMSEEEPLLAASATSLAEALAPFIDLERPYHQQKEAVLEGFLRAYFGALLEHTDGNQTEAARISELERSYLGKLLRKYDIT